MKKILALILFVVSANLSAQDVSYKIQKSDIFKDEYKNSDIVLADDNGNGGIVVVRSYAKGMMSPGGGYYFEQFDANMKMINDFEYAIKGPNSQKNHVVIGLVRSGNNINIIGLYYDITAKAIICKAHSVDFTSKKSTAKELFRITRDEIKPYGVFSLQQLFLNEGFTASPTPFYGQFTSADNPEDKLSNPGNADARGIGNASGIAFSINQKTNAFAVAIDIKSKNASYLKLSSFKSDLTQVNSYEIKNTSTSDRTFQTLTIDDNAQNMYVLSKVYLDTKKDIGAKYNYELLKISGNDTQTAVIETADYFIPQLQTTVTPANNIACVGLYSDSKKTQYSGICYFEADVASMSMSKKTYNPFPAAFITDKYGDRKPKELNYLNIRAISFTPQNELLLHAEEAYITTVYNGTTGNTTFYSYDDIMLAKLSAAGNLMWARNISKNQSSARTDTPYLSYSSVEKNGDSYFFINAAEKVKIHDDGRVDFGQVRANKSNLYLVKVASDSKLEYIEILDDQATEVPFMVARGISINNDVYFLGQKGSKKQLLKVTIE